MVKSDSSQPGLANMDENITASLYQPHNERYSIVSFLEKWIIFL
jgi:hypothetical protein